MAWAEYGGSGADDPAGPGAAARFAELWSEASDLCSSPMGLLPSRLAGISRQALFTDGAGLSILSGEHRVPIGSTDEDATRAEQLQFTVGEGPCLDTLHTRNPVQADRETMRRRWPVFYDQLVTGTPFRSIIAVPLTVSVGVVGALDLYFHDPHGAHRLDIIDAVVVANQISSLLRCDSTDDPKPPGREPSASMYGPTAQQRMRVWVASGVLMAHSKITGPDAMTLLRAYAYAEGKPIDDVADALIAGTAPIEDFIL
jgi:GAF domain-containing protein/ANTAR domain-containing protein